MTADIEKDDYVSGQFRTSSGPSGPPSSSAVMNRARTQLWKTFHGTKIKAGVCMCVCVLPSLAPYSQRCAAFPTVQLKGVEHDYLRHVAKDLCNRYNKVGTAGQTQSSSTIRIPSIDLLLSLTSVVHLQSIINSKLSTDRVGLGSVVINCHLQVR